MPTMNTSARAGGAANDDCDQQDLVFADGVLVEDDGTIIRTFTVHLRFATDAQWPAGMPVVVKGSARRFALEHCRTIRLSKPEQFRQQGETMISDLGEGITRHDVSSESVRVDDPADLRRAAESDDELNRGASAIGSTRRRTVKSSKTTNRSSAKTTDTYGKNGWIWCAAVQPENDEARDSWRQSLCDGYDFVTTIRSPRTFARMLARMAAQQIGPRDSVSTYTHPFSKQVTRHPSVSVFHGPVAYVDDPHAYVSEAAIEFERMLRSVFFKHIRYADQREYRFVVWTEEEPEEATLDLEVSAGMLAEVRGTPDYDHATAVNSSRGQQIEQQRPRAPDRGSVDDEAAIQPGGSPAEPTNCECCADKPVHVVVSSGELLQRAVAARFAAAIETFRRVALEERHSADLSAAAFHVEWIVMRLLLTFVDPIDSFAWTDGVLVVTFKTPEGSNVTAQMSVGAHGTAQYKITTDHGYEHVTCRDGFMIADTLVDDLDRLGLLTCAQVIAGGHVPPQPSIALQDTERIDERSSRNADIERMTVRNAPEMSEAEMDAANAEIERRTDDARITKLVVDLGPDGKVTARAVRQGLNGTYRQRVRHDHVTLRVETMNPNATVVIDPPDSAPHLDGHVVAVPDGEDTVITVTATSPDGTAQSEIKYIALRSAESEDEAA